MKKQRKLKTGENYDKVINLLCQTVDFQNLRARSVRRLQTARIGKFKYKTDWGGKPVAIAVIAYGEGEEEQTQEVSSEYNAGKLYLNINPSVYWNKEEIGEVVEKNFGVVKPGFKKPHVPTYFLNPDRVRDAFYERSALLEVSALVLEAKERVQQALDEYILTDEYKAGLQLAREDYTVEEIKKVLLRFKDATPDVLRRALNEFVMHEVMES